MSNICCKKSKSLIVCHVFFAIIGLFREVTEFPDSVRLARTTTKSLKTQKKKKSREEKKWTTSSRSTQARRRLLRHSPYQITHRPTTWRRTTIAASTTITTTITHPFDTAPCETTSMERRARTSTGQTRDVGRHSMTRTPTRRPWRRQMRTCRATPARRPRPTCSADRAMPDSTQLRRQPDQEDILPLRNRPPTYIFTQTPPDLISAARTFLTHLEFKAGNRRRFLCTVCHRCPLRQHSREWAEGQSFRAAASVRSTISWPNRGVLLTGVGMPGRHWTITIHITRCRSRFPLLFLKGSDFGPILPLWFR